MTGTTECCQVAKATPPRLRRRSAPRRRQTAPALTREADTALLSHRVVIVTPWHHEYKSAASYCFLFASVHPTRLQPLACVLRTTRYPPMALRGKRMLAKRARRRSSTCLGTWFGKRCARTFFFSATARCTMSGLPFSFHPLGLRRSAMVG